MTTQLAEIQPEYTEMMAFARDLARVQQRRLAPGTVPATEQGRPWFPVCTRPSIAQCSCHYGEYATPERRLAMQQFVVWYMKNYPWAKDYFHAQCVLQTVAEEELGRSLGIDELTLFDATFGKVWLAREKTEQVSEVTP